jgi:hypothetical protein
VQGWYDGGMQPTGVRAVLGSLLLVGAAAAAPAAEPAAPARLVLEAARIEPTAPGGERPGAETLCRLTVTLRNTGSETASALGFKVEINRQELAVYRSHLFYYAVAPGKATEVPLYNFWTTETGRPFPADGKLEVSVALVEAQWTRVATQEGVEVWTPLGAVSGLPSTAAVTLELERPPR